MPCVCFTNLWYHAFRWEETQNPQGLLLAIKSWLWRLKEIMVCTIFLPCHPSIVPQVAWRTPADSYCQIGNRVCTVLWYSVSVSYRYLLLLDTTHLLRLSKTFVVLSTWFLDPSMIFCIPNMNLCVMNFWFLQYHMPLYQFVLIINDSLVVFCLFCYVLFRLFISLT
jgi:hypothetical protein